MNDHDIAAAKVVAVLLADGWHRIVHGSFSVGSLGFGTGVDLGVPGFRFEEADAGSPYQPTVLAGPLDSVIAVRQVTPALRGVREPGQAWAAHNGQRADQGVRRPVRAARWVATG